MYSVKKISSTLSNKLNQYLEADYHIWDDSLIQARRKLIFRKLVTSSDPRLEASPEYQSGEMFSKMNIPLNASLLLSSLAKIKNSGVYPIPRLHQQKSLEKFLGEQTEIVVSTGTGSGKTECFLYPILGSFAIEKERGPGIVSKNGCRVLLLYPMNALVNDQLSRLRKMLGNEEVSLEIEKFRGRKPTFAVYTSKTDYPGKRNSKRDNKLKEKIKSLFLGDALKYKSELFGEGLWPAKNMEAFINNSLRSSTSDAELYSRHEVQDNTPDILITNYSMLEYMLARPIERHIFDSTAEWLNSHDENYLTVVLDEAHMYRGVAGAEVALLLRRLHSRLGVNRSKVRYILTSASFGTDNKNDAITFAKELTGKHDGAKPFELILGEKKSKSGAQLPTISQLQALANFDINSIHNIADSLSAAKKQIITLFSDLKLGIPANDLDSVEDLQNFVYEKLELFPTAAYLSNSLTKNSEPYADISKLFLGKFQDENAFESLLALCTFAQSKVNNQVYLPIRLHMMFRGLPGLFGCINPDCKDKENIEGKNLFGKLFTYPALKCGCGGRVFEILTHRDCGASFIRGYVNESSRDFLLHEQAQPLSETKLIETHFLIESDRSKSSRWNMQWIHIKSGKLVWSDPKSMDFIPVVVANNDRVDIDGNKNVWSFDNCPVCERVLIRNGASKIQDLATKGEAPFSYLVRTQVEEQPPTKTKNTRFPLRGRKALVFSDGRQKAARLARDIPRNVEKDIFRICLLLAVDYLQNIHKKNSLRKDLTYVAFLKVLLSKNVVLFDGDDRVKLEFDLRKLEGFDNDFAEALDDAWDPPATFSQLLLVNLLGKYYSLFALTLAYISPTSSYIKKFTLEATKLGLSESDCKQIVVNWLGIILESNFSFDKSISNGIRRSVNSGYGDDSHWGVEKGKSLSKLKLDFLDKSIKSELENLLINEFCELGENKRYFVNPSRIMINLHQNGIWNQCLYCTKLCVEKIREFCPYCGSDQIQSLDPNKSEYLRARKNFYRDPVIKALSNQDTEIFNLSVEEHTAQLSYRDENQYTSTNEISERRFKDILISPTDSVVDILSCTTTMEVGVDIGSLTAVSMRNVPPARQNYQQRAGRAGRRGSSISTVLTYAQTGSHDSYFFENPDKIISGDPISPKIDITNEKVIRRHVNAAILQSYFHRLNIDIENQSNDLLSVLGLTKEFYDKDKDKDFNFVSLESWLNSTFCSDGIKDSISSWIPSKTLDVREISLDLLDTLRNRKPNDFNDEKSYEDKFLNFLFACDLLPTYAFPRHICSFKIEERTDKYNDIDVIENPQQGLSTALTEYAPGRLVVINKKTYKIGSVTANSSSKEKNRSELLFKNKKVYLQCASCMFTEVYRDDSPNIEECTHCGNKTILKLDVIQPEVVYPEGKKAVNEYDDDLFTSASSAQLPFIGNAPNFELNKFKDIAAIGSESNQLLVAINKGNDNEGNGFWVCDKCGRASAEEDKPEDTHTRNYFVRNEPDNDKCFGGVFQKVNLGYSFNSDVFLMRIPLIEPLLPIGNGIEKNGLISASRTLAEALAQTASHELEIDPSEMNCGIRFLKIDGINNLDIFIYDTAAGGAGYANLIKEWINNVFMEARKSLVKTCCDSSCYLCLQHYGNRWHHNLIDKNFGLMLWNYVNSSMPPTPYESIEQESIASTLLELLLLHGYQHKGKSEKGLIVSFQSKELEIIIYPVLLIPEKVIKPTMENFIFISDYEALKSAPSAFAKVILK